MYSLIAYKSKAFIIGLLTILIASNEFTPVFSNLPLSRHLRSPDFIDKRSQMRSILGAFKIKSDTIIRTQDSRALGAKYINETDLPRNENCLMWCWETQLCNVAVFEDKDDHKTCYLFDCGTPSNFRCMFTSHNSYTSSILQVAKHAHDLKEWRSQAKHEDDLHGLQPAQPQLPHPSKQGEVGMPLQPPSLLPSLSSPSRSASESSTLAPVSHISTVAIQELLLKDQGVNCRVYQFKCANASECIAIYNVCDGIPQCPDGSDESEELRCPKSEDGNTLPSPHATSPSLPPQDVPKENLPSPHPSPLQYPPRPQVAYHPLPPPPPLPMVEDQHPLAPNLPPSLVDDQPNPNWIQQQQQQQQLMSAQDYAQNMRLPNGPQVFTHKHSNFMAANSAGGGSGGASAYPPSSRWNPEYYDASSNAAAGAPYNGQQYFPSRHYRPQPELPYYPQRSELGPHQQQQQRAMEESQRLVPNQWPINDDQQPRQNLYPGQQPPAMDYRWNPKTGSEPEEEELYQPIVELPSTMSPPSTSSEATSPRPTLSLQARAFKMIKTHPDETKGAVLAVVLGLSITALFVILLGCRINSIKHRLSRKRRSLVHDADYLVNGMYL